MADFANMTKSEALQYCYDHENQYKAEIYAGGDDGCRLFDCLITILEDEVIGPVELPDYGMDYD